MDSSLSEILSFDVHIGLDASDDDIVDVIRRIRPTWTSDKVVIMPVSGGFINRLVSIHLQEDESKQDAILLRILSDNRPFVMNTRDEVVAVRLAINAGCVPTVYATFNNGLLQKYIDEEPMFYRDLLEDANNSRNAATALAKLHDRQREHSQLRDVDQEPVVFRRIRHFIDGIPDEYTDDEVLGNAITLKKSLHKEVELLEEHFDSGNMRIVFGHNDFHAFNIMRQRNSGNIYLTDFEFAGPNYDVMDFAYSKHIFRTLQILGAEAKGYTPSSDDYRPMIRYYLQERARLDGQTPDDVTDGDVDEFCRQVHHVAPVCKFYIVLLGIMCLVWPVISSGKDLIIECYRHALKQYCESRTLVVPKDTVFVI